MKSGSQLKDSLKIKKWKEDHNKQIRAFLGIILSDTVQKSQNKTREKLHLLEEQRFEQAGAGGHLHLGPIRAAVVG